MSPESPSEENIDIYDGLDPINRPLDYALVLWPEDFQCQRPPRRSDVGVDRDLYDELRMLTVNVREKAGLILRAVIFETPEGQKGIQRGKDCRKAFLNENVQRLTDEERSTGAKERREEAAAHLARKTVEHLRADPNFLAAALSNTKVFTVALSEEETRNIGGFAGYARTGNRLVITNPFEAFTYPRSRDGRPTAENAGSLTRTDWLREMLISAKFKLINELNSQLVLYGYKDGDAAKSGPIDAKDCIVSISDLEFTPERNGVLNIKGFLGFVGRGKLEITDIRWKDAAIEQLA